MSTAAAATSRPKRSRSPFVWAKPEIPRLGWRLDFVEDTEVDDTTCEFCDNPHVRYIHHLVHAAHAPLAVGCVCAGHMTGDYVTHRARERALKNAQARMKSDFSRWRDVSTWRVNRHGNYSLSAGDTGATILVRGGGWRVLVGVGDSVTWLDETFPTVAAAAAAVARRLHRRIRRDDDVEIARRAAQIEARARRRAARLNFRSYDDDRPTDAEPLTDAEVAAFAEACWNYSH